MNSHVTIYQDINELHRIAWRFYYNSSLGIQLDRWADETRATKRHKFKSSQWEKTEWLRLSGNARANRIEKPLVPKIVADAAIIEFSKSLTFAPGQLEEEAA